MKMDFQESLNSLPQPLTLERWTEMTHSEAVNKAVADFQHGDAAAKKRLPAVTWQASFAGKRRSNANAIPSGLYMLDLDHLEGNTAQIFTERIMPHVRDCGILLVHTTPSGHGLRVVARMQRAQSFPTIREFQLWLAAQLGFKAEEVDLCTKDMARLSFVPPRALRPLPRPAHLPRRPRVCRALRRSCLACFLRDDGEAESEGQGRDSGNVG